MKPFRGQERLGYHLVFAHVIFVLDRNFTLFHLSSSNRTWPQALRCQSTVGTEKEVSQEVSRASSTMKSFIRVLLSCLSFLLVDFSDCYNVIYPSQILAQSYAQRRNDANPANARPPLRTLSPAGTV